MSSTSRSPVFYDPQQKRWPRLRKVLLALALIVSLLFGLLLISILIQPVLPELDLPVVSLLPSRPSMAPPSPQPFQPPPPATLRKSKEALEQARRVPQKSSKRRGQPKAVGRQLAVAYFVNWDAASLASLRAHISQLDVLIPEWLHVCAADGALKEDDPPLQKEVAEYVRSRQPEMLILPLVNNYWNGAWQGEGMQQLLSSPQSRARLIGAILQYLQANHFPGVCIDFEELPERRRGWYDKFVSDLAQALRREKLLLGVHLPLDGDTPIPPRLASEADLLILMAYNQHWSTSVPGPLASQNWFAKQLEQRKAELPPEKTILALGTFGYDWPTGKNAETCTFEDALGRASLSKAKIEYDASLNPAFCYQDERGVAHTVWLLDAVTTFNQIAMARNFRVRGLALWRLGGEDPSLWTFFGRDRALDAAAAKGLEDVQFSQRVDHAGEGEVLRLSTLARPGKRQIEFDERAGCIRSASYSELPSACVIARYGAAPKKIALTFDDGPDPAYTPEILGVLRETGTPATFFVVGVNGELHPELLQRMVDEGHEIGNHTFTHPNLAEASELQMEAELSATQRLLESVISRRTVLFRAPYGEGDDPSRADQLQVLTRATAQGYLMVGMHVDPSDWQRPGAPEIVRRAVEQIGKNAGNIVLLHDSGGDRTQTVEALPLLIRELRAYGYEFVTVSSLLGRTRDDCMPPLVAGQWYALLNRAAFWLLNAAHAALYWLFIGGTALGVARLLLIGTLAIYEHRHQRRRAFDPNYKPTVAVIVPAYNEEKVVAQTIRSLLASDYSGPFEIVVVDDGSKDKTYEAAKAAFPSDARVRIFSTENGGKSAALNFGILQTQAEIIVALDADTVFAKDTVSKLVRHFASPRVAAVAGNAKVGNRLNLLTRWQALEYITSQNLDRRAFSALNCITVVPGAVGAWRRELILQARGFTRHTLAEDADLTLSLRRMGYAIVNEPDALAYTEAPDTIRGFVRQRYRWMFGTLQAAWKHKDTLFRPRYGALGSIALPNIFIFQVLFPLISPVMDLLTIGAIATAVFYGAGSSGTLGSILFYYSLFIVVDFLAAWVAFKLEPKEDRWLLVWLFWQRFCYRQLMYYVAIKSTLATLRGVEVGWGKLERKATVQVQ